jgi:hypothetical protein
MAEKINLTLKKPDIVSLVQKKLGKAISKTKIFDVMTIFTDYISEELENDRNVYLEGFGVFSLTSIDGKRIVKFRPHEKFKKLKKRQKKKSLGRLDKKS